jgi:acetyl-CoA acetyltransferase
VKTRMAVVGVGQTSYKRAHTELSSADMIWEAAEKALDDAAMDISAVDAIVMGVAPDALAGENGVEKTAIFGAGKPYVPGEGLPRHQPGADGPGHHLTAGVQHDLRPGV